jgi:hypothetical protein
MDRKPLLVLILMIIGFGIAVAAAIWVFGSKNLEAHRVGIINDLNHIAANAYQYRMKPATLGGGGGSFRGYAIPGKLTVTGFGFYEIDSTSEGDVLIIQATAAQRLGTVEARVETTGVLKVLLYTGDLLD